MTYELWDFTTNNMLWDGDTRQEAEERLAFFRPLGRYGPEGHDLRIIEFDSDGLVVGTPERNDH